MPSFSSVLASCLVGVYSATGVLAGKASYYTPDGGTGACGKKLKNNDMILALPKAAYAGGKNCHKTVSVTYKGKTLKGKVEDLCPECPSDQVDLSEGWFKQFAPTSQGILHDLTWKLE
ncbi:hypothetical protein NLG97_g379 [Lecanicillium saksenae]|uniref:Uncharacterized protein n=1 Tax=Lecanicillium saksenae TaxID=468837 RepID=A0ACC1R6P6_9HYPO|nr:hypothetical protein NLG97_g379 [Lecanicillium saksenae]